jgi:hypothetical protein
MNNLSLRTYLKEYKVPIALACLASFFLATLLWHFYPISYSCCDASIYWETAGYFSNGSSYTIFRTFVYPTLIAISQSLANVLGFGVEGAQIGLSMFQLCLHFLASIALGYIAYSLTHNKLATTCALFINILNIFLLAYTNQVLTDGVAISSLTITIAVIVLCLNQPHPNTLWIGISGLAIGTLPFIRPSLLTGTLAISITFFFIYLYKYKFRYSEIPKIGAYLFCALIPLLIQFLLAPTAILDFGSLGNYQFIQGTYVYKYMTLVQPTPHGLAALNQSMKNLVEVCGISPDATPCVKNILLTHPLQSIAHYATKLFAINDQVYLTPYVSNFYAPERQSWRTINSFLSAMSILGAIVVVRKGLKDANIYHLVYAIAAAALIGVLVIPLVVGAPEERFGLTFHPFFAIFTGCFIHNFRLAPPSTKPRILIQCFGLAVALIICSLQLETLLNFRLNG